MLLLSLLHKAKASLDQLATVSPVCPTGPDIAQAIRAGRADTGIATRSVANSAGLDFVPIVWEPFDLLMRQRDYFHAPLQALIRFLHSDELAARAREMGGLENRMPITSVMFSATLRIEPRYFVSVGSMWLRFMPPWISAITRPINQRPMIQNAIAMLVDDRLAEEDDVGNLTVDRHHRGIRRGHDHQVRPLEPLADELPEGLSLRGVWFDGQQSADVSLHGLRHPGVLGTRRPASAGLRQRFRSCAPRTVSQSMCHECRSRADAIST